MNPSQEYPVPDRDGERYRLVGIAAYDLEAVEGAGQLELFADPRHERARRLDKAVDAVRERFGDGALVKADRIKEDED